MRHSHLWGASESPEFFGHRLQTSRTHETVEESTAGLGQSFRTGRPLVGGLCFHGVSGLCMNHLAHWQPRGIQGPGCMRHQSLALGGRPTTCDRHALGGAQDGEQRGPDLKHIKPNKASSASRKSSGSPGWLRGSCVRFAVRTSRRMSRRQSIHSPNRTCHEPCVWVGVGQGGEGKRRERKRSVGGRSRTLRVHLTDLAGQTE